MNSGHFPEGLKLTEDEAYALLSLCLTSPNGIDGVSERALKKLADYCSSRSNPKDNHKSRPTSFMSTRELGTAGA